MDVSLSCGRWRLEFLPSTKNFADRPGLRNTSAWMMGNIAIEDFRERSETVRINRFCQRLKKSACGRVVLVNSIVSERKRPKQPAPHSALVVGGITLARSTGINAGVTVFVPRKTPQSKGGQQLRRARIHDSLLLFSWKQASA